MLGCTQTITVFNKYKTCTGEKYKAAILKGVSITQVAGQTFNKDGSQQNGNTTVIIPNNVKGYLSPGQWKGHYCTWTLRPGDLIVKGTYPGMEATFKELLKNYYVATVISIEDNTSGMLGHWKVVGNSAGIC